MRRRLESFFRAGFLQEEIDGIGEACRKDGEGRTRGLAERPIVACFGGDRHFFERGGGGVGRRGFGGQGFRVPSRALIDPVLNQGDLCCGECAVERHCRLFEPGDDAVEAALGSIAGDEGRTALTAFERALAGSQVQLRKLNCRAVALPAMGFHERTDVGREGNRVVRGMQRGKSTDEDEEGLLTVE